MLVIQKVNYIRRCVVQQIRDYLILPDNLQNPLCNSLLDTISSSISQWNLLSSSSNNLLRVAVPSYGTPEWQFQDQKDFTFTATLLLLKSMLRSANAIALVSIPHHLLSVIPQNIF